MDLVPNVLRGVEEVDLSTTIFGKKLDLPFYLSPTALQRLFHYDGERAVGKAAKKFILVLLILTLPSKLIGDTDIENDNHQFNLYLGNFDFSDDKQKATLLGFQHQNENLNRNTFLGNISPVTGGFITENSAAYIYTGVEWNMDMGPFFFTPSFTPGLYHEGDGKDLGHFLEFKSELQLSYKTTDTTNFAVSYNHVSNASLGDKNPGANSYMFNLLKKF